MNTCKTSNPNWIKIDSDFDLSSIQAYYWSLSMISLADDQTYDCDLADCDHYNCTLIDTFNITRSDRLLFPELEYYSYFSVWSSEYTGIDSDMNKSIFDDYMPVYALGL